MTAISPPLIAELSSLEHWMNTNQLVDMVKDRNVYQV